MSNQQFGFGIIGAGMISGIHAMAIKHIDNAKLIGVYSTNKKKSDDFAKENDCMHLIRWMH